MKKYLVIAPHTDDGELGCGATISKIIRHGAEVYYVAFSSCEESLPQGTPKDTLIKELYNATAILGLKQENVRVLKFPVRKFERDRQEILEAMVSINKELDPDVVFSPSIHDVHQDHVTIANECMRAFKKKTIFQYEIPWNNYSFQNQMFFCVEEQDVNNKINSVKCYLSQKNREYTKEEFIRAQLLMHGVQIGGKYAEVFEVPHMIIHDEEIF